MFLPPVFAPAAKTVPVAPPSRIGGTAAACAAAGFVVDAAFFAGDAAAFGADGAEAEAEAEGAALEAVGLPIAA